MVDIDDIEFKRKALQDSLDSQKTLKERNRLGQFSTPKILSDSIVKAALAYNKDEIRFLDTSIGTGVFFSSLLACSDRHTVLYAQGYEVDKHYAIPAMELWQGTKINYFLGDFFDFTPPQKNDEKFNVIISNPPYIRHHYIINEVKKKLNERIQLNFGLSFSGLMGLYGYFLALSALWLQDNGISVWLVPNEFLDVNYGEEIKTFLLTKVNLLRIHRFNPENVQFSDALVTSTVVFYTTGITAAPVLFTTGQDINNPDYQKKIAFQRLCPNDKWSHYFSSQKQRNKPMNTIGDYFSVKRGIATGSNKHFILTNEQVEKINIPNKYIKSILPSPRYIKDNVIKISKDGYIGDIQSKYLLNITCLEHEIVDLPQKLIDYLNIIYSEVKDNYIIRNRSPWFKQEYRPECPFLMSYMSRNTKEPFRLFLNKTNATAPNVYLMLYPKFDWKKAEVQNEGFLDYLHNNLQRISAETFVSSGRVYGGGLYKLEPKELMSVPLDDILSEYLINLEVFVV
ncbi:MAG: Eco57I restriction-modification methylase domain-containing protein, partial [Bacteroidales bacterium]|nr:Eco57I restriction-modification methylase domain-containing protein [Bacteroidales bacterium]